MITETEILSSLAPDTEKSRPAALNQSKVARIGGIGQTGILAAPRKERKGTARTAREAQKIQRTEVPRKNESVGRAQHIQTGRRASPPIFIRSWTMARTGIPG
jgi:hypothetical protein